jgi:hypothetical protein
MESDVQTVKDMAMSELEKTERDREGADRRLQSRFAVLPNGAGLMGKFWKLRVVDPL